MQASQTAPAQKMVFVCDDDNDIAEVTKLIIERHNYKVIVFTECEEVVDAAEHYNPDLILMDLWMPKMGGENLVKLLKENSKTKNIPVYVFSATRDVVAAVRRSGADGYLNKPYNISDLDNLLEKELNDVT